MNQRATKGTAALIFCVLALFLVISPVFAEDDEDLMDLDALGDFNAEPKAGAEDTGIGGGNAIFSGKLLTKTAHDFRKENDEEYLLSSLSYATASAAVTVNPKLAVTLEGLFMYEARTNYDEVDTEFDVDLWQGNVRWKVGPLDITLGRQIVAWGQADVVNPTDLVNPRDYTRFLDAELGYSKLPVTMARVEWYLPKSQKLDVVLLPFFRPAKFSIVSEDVALFAHEFPLFFLMNELRSNPDFYRAERAIDLWYPDWEEDLRALLEDPVFWENRTLKYEDDFTHAEAALRYSGRLSGWDYSVSYGYLWDDIPTMHLNPSFVNYFTSLNRTENEYTKVPYPVRDLYQPDTLLEPFTLVYHRTHSVGADLGTIVGGVGLRAEAQYSFAKYTYTDRLGTRRKPVVNGVLNADYTFKHNIMFTGLILFSSVIDYESYLLMPPTYRLVGFGMRKPWLSDKLLTEMAFMYDFSYMDNEKLSEGQLFGEDGMWTPMITYNITDPFKIRFGANLLFGERYQLLGMLRENSRGFVTLEYSF